MIKKLFSKKKPTTAEDDSGNLSADFRAATTFQIAIQQHQAGNFAQADALYRQILQHEPNHPDALHFLGVLAYQVGQNEAAVGLISKAVSVYPNSSAMHSNLGLALQALGRLEQAIESFQTAIELQPDSVDTYYNIGNVFRDLGKFDEAIKHYEKVLLLQPDHQDAKLNLGLSLLSLGRYFEGWQYYEARYAEQLKCQDKRKISFPTLFFPQWQGESIVGKTLLICLEQGLGDEIQFSRYIPILKQQGAAFISLVCRKQLKPLFERMPAIDQVLVANEVLNFQKHDYWTPILSLPLHCKTTPATIPAQIPYLYPDSELVNNIATELSAIGEFKVGICWKGDPNYRGDNLRSPGIAAFKSLFKLSGVKFFNLQPNTREELLLNAGNSGVDRGHEINETSFEEATALIMNLDLVISSCTSICHLAGALGKPVWVVLPFVADWRWFVEREDSPWYPNTRLFRQATRGDWSEVFQRVENSLKQLVINSGREV